MTFLELLLKRNEYKDKAEKFIKNMVELLVIMKQVIMYLLKKLNNMINKNGDLTIIGVTHVINLVNLTKIGKMIIGGYFGVCQVL